jgi:DNA ligase (NAD+)
MNNKIKELKDKINQARINYYNKTSNISDVVYDAWIEELSILDPKNNLITDIGAEPDSEWEKYTHKVTMGSLNKVNNFEHFNKWCSNYIDVKDNIFCTLKLDGLSVSLIYENGIIKNGVLRGNGIAGENIINNIVKMNIPLRLNKNINATIRGEIMLSKTNHSKYFAEYSNPRNGASGISRRYDGYGSQHLKIITYQIITDDVSIEFENQQFELLKSFGFEVPDSWIFTNAEDANNFKNEFQTNKKNNYDFELDGLVFRNNNIIKQNEFGENHGRPYAAIAYKFAHYGKETTILNIEWNCGSKGIISKATLHNYSYIKNLNLDIGARVLVIRANQVIPKITETIESTGTIAACPTLCPSCNENLFLDGEQLFCYNLDCMAQIIGKIQTWASELNILELGDKIIEKLIESKLISDVADLYTLKENDIANLERMGYQSAINLLNSLEKSKQITLEKMFGSLNIKNIGVNSVKLIVDAGFNTLYKILNITINDLNNIKGLGPIKSDLFIKGIEHNKTLINKLIKNGVIIIEKNNLKLNNKSFVLTGAMANNRKELESRIEASGGVVKSSVIKGLNYLVIADLNSSSIKAISARKINVQLISENELLEML